jgi:hypothetical protein
VTKSIVRILSKRFSVDFSEIITNCII